MQCRFLLTQTHPEHLFLPSSKSIEAHKQRSASKSSWGKDDFSAVKKVITDLKGYVASM